MRMVVKAYLFTSLLVTCDLAVQVVPKATIKKTEVDYLSNLTTDSFLMKTTENSSYTIDSEMTAGTFTHAQTQQGLNNGLQNTEAEYKTSYGPGGSTSPTAVLTNPTAAVYKEVNSSMDGINTESSNVEGNTL